MSSAHLFPVSDDELLISVYMKQGRTLDDLPYTPQFEAIYGALGGAEMGMTRSQLLHRLQNLRKSGKLPRLGKAVDSRPRIDPQQERTLSQLVEQEIGQMGQRDQLPYTDAFDRIVTAFNAQAGLSLSAHDVWRLVAKLAK